MNPTKPDISPEKVPQSLGVLYALVDRIADAMIGGLQLHKHQASAIRAFTDGMNRGQNQNQIAFNASDYHLIAVGQLNENYTITPMRPTEIINGEMWLATQTNTEKK